MQAFETTRCRIWLLLNDMYRLYGRGQDVNPVGSGPRVQGQVLSNIGALIISYPILGGSLL